MELNFNMQSRWFKRWVSGALLAAAFGAANAAGPAPLKRAFDLPPSAELSYSIKARQKGFTLSGTAVIDWRTADGKYTLSSESRAALLGKILENRSEGLIDQFGLAPLQFYEKHFRRDAWTTTFNRDSKTISFTEGKQSYTLKGGEQDRGSAPWQLASLARAAPDKFTPGSEWSFLVAGRRDAEQWTFKVVKRETISTGLGQVVAVHLVKAPPPDSKEQAVDIWLAPAHEWYPVRLRFSENGNEFVEQTIEQITKNNG